MLDTSKQYITKENLITYTQALSDKQEAQNTAIKASIVGLKTKNNLLLEDIIKLENETVKLHSGEQKLVGDVTIAKDSQDKYGNLVVEGNLEVKGTTVTKDTETIVVHDNFIVLNSDGEELNTQLSGIGIKINKDQAYGIAYDQENQSVSLGLGSISNGDFAFKEGESKPILTRDVSNNIKHGHLLVWDSDRQIAVDGGTTQDLDVLRETFTTWEAYRDLSKKIDQDKSTIESKVEAEASDRISGDEAIVQLLETTKNDLQNTLEATNQRLSNIEDTDSMVQEMYNNIDSIKKQIVAGTQSPDGMWALSFTVVRDPDNNIIGYEPCFIPFDDGELR